MKLGIFGGTFDPLHLGHLIVADDAAAALKLDRVLFIPAGSHPFKGSEVEAAANLRIRMVEEATKGSELFAVDEREVRRAGPSYTIDTVGELERELPGVELYVLVGADILAEIGDWHRSAELTSRVTVAVMTRGGVDTWTAPEGFDCTRVDVTHIGISSTDIRRRVREGEPFRYLVPEAVYRIINEHALYKRP